jgi:hypothetical protein
MKSMTTNLMITAAALVIATGVASAQQYRADIPFAFRAGSQTLAPGTYEVHVKDAEHYMTVLTSRDTRRSVILVPVARADGPKGAAAGIPVLTFACGSSRCSLTQIWTGTAYPALMFAQPRPSKDEQISATEIRLVKVNGD